MVWPEAATPWQPHPTNNIALAVKVKWGLKMHWHMLVSGEAEPKSVPRAPPFRVLDKHLPCVIRVSIGLGIGLI